MISDDIFRVYAPNETMAETVFASACKVYANTNNEDFKDYWNDLHEKLSKKQYKIIHNIDFIGVRKI